MNSDAMPYPELDNTSFLGLRLLRLTDYTCVEDNDAWTDLLFSDGYIWDKCSELRDVTHAMPEQ